jgi:hypothetical protein
MKDDGLEVLTRLRADADVAAVVSADIQTSPTDAVDEPCQGVHQMPPIESNPMGEPEP